MHISEGILTGPSMAITLGLGATAVAYGVHATNRFVATKPQRKPLLAMAGAFVFLVSLVPLPSYAGTCSHPCGTPLAAILLGPGVTILLSCLALFLQAAFFAHGGFSSLGANTITLGVVGGCSGWATYHLARRAGLSRLWAGALAGLVGDVLTYVAAGFTLAAHLAWVVPQPKMDLIGYLKVIYAGYLPVQTPLSIGEAFFTGWALYSIGRQRPEVLEDLGVEDKPAAKSKAKAAVKTAAVALLLMALPLLAHATDQAPAAAAPAAAQAHPVDTPVPGAYTGMDEKVNEAMAAAGGAPARAPFLNTEKLGDLWNLILLLGGAIAGFIVGLNWNQLFGKSPAPAASPAKKQPARKGKA